MKVLENLLYTKEHDWLKVEGDRAYLGITDHAQKSLGNIVYVDLPSVDNEFSAGDTFGVIESVKAASDCYIPVDGKILEVNEKLSDDPSLLNQDPYENWMICFEIKDKTQLYGLMNAEEYIKYCNEEA